jgi:hypothetical protein
MVVHWVQPGRGLVESAQAVRLTGPFGKAEESKQRERQIPPHGHAVTAPLHAGRTGAGAGITRPVGSWRTSDSGSAPDPEIVRISVLTLVSRTTGAYGT